MSQSLPDLPVAREQTTCAAAVASYQLAVFCAQAWPRSSLGKPFPAWALPSKGVPTPQHAAVQRLADDLETCQTAKRRAVVKLQRVNCGATPALPLMCHAAAPSDAVQTPRHTSLASHQWPLPSLQTTHGNLCKPPKTCAPSALPFAKVEPYCARCRHARTAPRSRQS